MVKLMSGVSILDMLKYVSEYSSTQYMSHPLLPRCLYDYKAGGRALED